MWISPHFKLEEFTRSTTADRLKIDNTPPLPVVANLQQLCLLVLEPARNDLQQCINITSGYRCQELNKAVGGVANSQHLTGHACDIHLPTKYYADRLFNIIKYQNMFDQLLYERSNTAQWLHVSWAERPRHQATYNYRLRS